MTTSRRSDDLFVKLFYTACSVFTGVFLWPIGRLAGFEAWPGPRLFFELLVGAALVVVPLWWLPQVRRTPFGLPRSWLEVPLLVWAWLSPLAAVFMIWGVLTLAAVAIFPFIWSVALTLPAATLIVFLTWHLPADQEPSRSHRSSP